MRRTLLAAAISFLAAGPAFAEIAGMATVLDGDILSINGQKVRLYGIDSVEFHQYCYVNGKPWSCGTAAIRSMQTLVSVQPMVCTETGGSDGDRGIWARCDLGGLDVALDAVRNGFAVALRDQTSDYNAAEDEARTARKGIWESNFIEPWTYRDDMAAIARVITERQQAAARATVEAALTGDNAGLDIFTGVQAGRGDAADAAPRQIVIDEIKDGFLFGTIAGDVLNWMDQATGLADWRRGVVGQARAMAATYIWQSLLTQPRRVVETPDAATFLSALADAAQPIRDAGRVPVLIVRGAGDPPWISEWTRDAAVPEGEVLPPAEVTHKDDITAPTYIATINGVDVYRIEALAEQDAFVIPSDILASVTFVEGLGKQVIAISEVPQTDDAAPKLVFAYNQAITWKPDEVVVLRYPYKPPASPY